MSTRSQDSFKHLESQGFDVYFPGFHKGECLSPYVVVKEGTTIPVTGFSSRMKTIELLCYVPENAYSTLCEYVDSVDKAMKSLEPMIMSLYQRDPDYHDTDVKAWMTTTYFRNYIKN